MARFKRFFRRAKKVLLLLVVLYVLAVVFSNLETWEVNLVFGKVHIPALLLMLILVGAGFTGGLYLSRNYKILLIRNQEAVAAGLVESLKGGRPAEDEPVKTPEPEAAPEPQPQPRPLATPEPEPQQEPQATTDAPSEPETGTEPQTPPDTQQAPQEEPEPRHEDPPDANPPAAELEG